MPHLKQKDGFIIVEALLAIAIFGMILTGILSFYVYAEAAKSNSFNKLQAIELNSECQEAVKNIRDFSFSALTDGTHALSTASNAWALSAVYPETIGNFVRQLEIAPLDQYRKEVTCTTSWSSLFSGLQALNTTTILSNWARIVNTLGNWGAATLESFLDIPGNANGLELDYKDNYAYLVTNANTGNFVIINTSNTAAPTIAATLSLNNTLTNITVEGNYAYVTSTNNSSELIIVDISNPASPFVSGSYNVAGNADPTAVQISGSYAYVILKTSTGVEIAVVNISNPALPTLAGSANFGSDLLDIYINGSTAYVVTASNTEELQVWNISNASSISKIGTLNIAGNADGISVHGFSNYIAVGRADGSIAVVDVSAGNAPSLITTLSAGASVNDVYFDPNTNYLFAVTSRAVGEFQVWDATIIATPAYLGSYDATNNLNGVVYDYVTNRAYIAGHSNSQEFLILKSQ